MIPKSFKKCLEQRVLVHPGHMWGSPTGPPGPWPIPYAEERSLTTSRRHTHTPYDSVYTKSKNRQKETRVTEVRSSCPQDRACGKPVEMGPGELSKVAGKFSILLWMVVMWAYM